MANAGGMAVSDFWRRVGRHRGGWLGYIVMPRASMQESAFKSYKLGPLGLCWYDFGQKSPM